MLKTGGEKLAMGVQLCYNNPNIRGADPEISADLRVSAAWQRKPAKSGHEHCNLKKLNALQKRATYEGSRKRGQKRTKEDIRAVKRSRFSDVVNIVTTLTPFWALSLIVCVLLSGCGQAPTSTAAAPTVRPEVPTPVPAAPALPPQTVASPVMPAKAATVAAAPKPPSDPKDFEAKLQEIVRLEERAEFGRAQELCRTLSTTFDDHPEFAEAIYDTTSRLAIEKNQADSVGFAATGLIDPGCAEIAAQAFFDAGDTGKLLLRRAYLNSGENGARDEALKFTILQKLTTMGDEKIGELVAERLAHNPPDATRRQLLEMLWSRISHTDAQCLPALFAVAQAAAEKNTDLTAFLLAAARRAGIDQPAEFNQAFHAAAAYDFFKNQGLLNAVGNDGLAVCFTFDEKSGNSAVNSAPNGKSATGKATVIPGKKDSAVKFDGANDVLMLPDSGLGIGQAGADFTLAFWFNLEKSATGDWRTITHKGNGDDERTFALWMRPGDDAMHCRISTLGNGNDGVEATVSKIPLNAWTHVAYVKRGRTLKVFLNGAKDSEVTLEGRVVSNNGAIYIGKDPWHPGTACAIDEYRIYQRALTESEVRLLAWLPTP